MLKGLFLVCSVLVFTHFSNAQYPFFEEDTKLPQELEVLVGELHASQIPMRKKLTKLFFEVKRNYLNHHQLSSTYASTLRGETYDCVTGTLLFDNLLRALGLETTIHEFNHHVLLAVHTDKEDFLFDSTDPYGMIRGRRDIAATIAFYKRQKEVLPNKNIYETIEADQAIGLYYFNQSVKHLDTEEIGAARAYAALALQQYPCDRTFALSDLLSRPPQQILSVYGSK